MRRTTIETVRRDRLRTFAIAAWLAVGVLAACEEPKTPAPAALPPIGPNELRAPEDFAVIEDRDERARAMFTEATKVLFHPRCSNCHPSGDVPLQGDDRRAHDPPVVRGPDDHGVPALRCGSCHQDRNLELARVPGAPKWALAPIGMAWVGRSASSVCQQIKDRSRNGDKTLAQIVEHVSHDGLVAWGWDPGHGRTKAPGTQERFGELVAAWVAAGAACPGEEAR